MYCRTFGGLGLFGKFKWNTKTDTPTLNVKKNKNLLSQGWLAAAIGWKTTSNTQFEYDFCFPCVCPSLSCHWSLHIESKATISPPLAMLRPCPKGTNENWTKGLKKKYSSPKVSIWEFIPCPPPQKKKKRWGFCCLVKGTFYLGKSESTVSLKNMNSTAATLNQQKTDVFIFQHSSQNSSTIFHDIPVF